MKVLTDALQKISHVVERVYLLLWGDSVTSDPKSSLEIKYVFF